MRTPEEWTRMYFSLGPSIPTSAEEQLEEVIAAAQAEARREALEEAAREISTVCVVRVQGREYLSRETVEDRIRALAARDGERKPDPPSAKEYSAECDRRGVAQLTEREYRDWLSERKPEGT